MLPLYPPQVSQPFFIIMSSLLSIKMKTTFQIKKFP